MNTIEQIKVLSDMFGPSGFEDKVAAFVAEQLKATSWLEKMIAIIGEMVSTIDKINSTYTNVEQTVSSMIKSK